MTDESIYFMESQKRIADLKNTTAYLAEINATAACLDLFTREGQFLATALEYQLKLNISPKAFTVAGAEVKEVAARDFSITASVMSAYGEKINNADLKGLTAYTYTRLYRGKVLDQLNDCKYILELIAVHATGLVDYKINAKYITDLQGLVTQLEQISKLPQDIIKQHAIDNTMYEDHEKLTKKFFDKEMDAFMEIYRKEYVEFYLAYIAARKVRHHHLKRKAKLPDVEKTTGILELLVLDKVKMESLAGVNLVVMALNLSESTDVDGETYNDEIAPGTYAGVLSCDGYKSMSFDFVIKAGETSTLQFLMESNN